MTSEKDIASQTIKQVLINEHDFRQSSEVFEGHQIYKNEDAILITSTRDMIHCGHLEDHFEAEAFIFCSRHSAKSGQPALLVHSTGNLGEEALFGGDPFSLSVSSASLVAAALKRLALEKEERDLEQFDITMEATHHGPTSMNTPLVFIELGSDEDFWRHKEGAHAVAAARRLLGRGAPDADPAEGRGQVVPAGAAGVPERGRRERAHGSDRGGPRCASAAGGGAPGQAASRHAVQRFRGRQASQAGNGGTVLPGVRRRARSGNRGRLRGGNGAHVFPDPR